jgi:hypothetical protein
MNKGLEANTTPSPFSASSNVRESQKIWRLSDGGFFMNLSATTRDSRIC